MVERMWSSSKDPLDRQAYKQQLNDYHRLLKRAKKKHFIKGLEDNSCSAK